MAVAQQPAGPVEERFDIGAVLLQAIMALEMTGNGLAQIVREVGPGVEGAPALDQFVMLRRIEVDAARLRRPFFRPAKP